MAASSEFSFRAVLDLWGVSNDDAERYGLCRKLNDPLPNRPLYKQTEHENYFCSVSSFKPVPEGTLNEAELQTGRGAQEGLRSRLEAPAENSTQYDENATSLHAHRSAVHEIKPVENSPTSNNGDRSLQVDVRSRYESEVIAICRWCHCENQLKLSWCENCGRVINEDQKYSPCRDLLKGGTQTLDSSHYGNAQTNREWWSNFSNTQTSKYTQLQAQGNSYLRHWKKSSFYSWRKPSSSLRLVDDNINDIAVDQLSKLYNLYIDYHIWNLNEYKTLVRQSSGLTISNDYEVCLY